MIRQLAFFLILLTAGALARPRWQHYNLDVSLNVPTGWKIIQGPVMLSLDPKQKLKGERRPNFGLTWQQTPPTLDEFRDRMVKTVAKKGGTLLATQRLVISNYPALLVKARLPEKAFQMEVEVLLIRVDQFAGYQVVCESMHEDAAAVSPVFHQILDDLRVGPRPRAKQLPVVNE
ncbi:hypothetical protein JST97_03000 [bacterium]|nr:hypothetical protein [bacterium]